MLTRETVFASELLGSSHHSVCHRLTKATCPVCTAEAELANSSLLALRVAHAFNPSCRETQIGRSLHSRPVCSTNKAGGTQEHIPRFS